MEERVMIFIDGSNLYHGCRRFEKDFKLDYEKLKDLLSDKRRLIRPYYYGSIAIKTQIASSQKQFHTFLERVGYDIIVSPIRKRGKRFIEKGADVSLVTDMLSMGLNKNYDTAILVSGDEDFIRAIQEIKKSGRRVEIVYFKDQISSKLRNCADKFIPLDELMGQLKQEKAK